MGSGSSKISHGTRRLGAIKATNVGGEAKLVNQTRFEARSQKAANQEDSTAKPTTNSAADQFFDIPKQPKPTTSKGDKDGFDPQYLSNINQLSSLISSNKENANKYSKNVRLFTLIRPLN